MNEIIEKAKDMFKESWTKGTDFTLKTGSEWLKPRTTFALLFYGTYIYLVVKGLPIPEGLKTIVDLLMGFFFGSKVAGKFNNGGQK